MLRTQNCDCFKVIQMVSKLAGRLAVVAVAAAAGILSKNKTEPTKRSIFGIILAFLTFPSEMANPTKSQEMPNNMRIITYRSWCIHHVRICAFVCISVYTVLYNVHVHTSKCLVYPNIWTLTEIMVYRFYRMDEIESAGATPTTAITTTILASVQSSLYEFENMRYVFVCSEYTPYDMK